MPDHLISPHGGKLIDLLVDAERAKALKAESRDWPSWDLTPRQLCDLELLLNGAFSPLTGFLTRKDYDSVCQSQRLSDGTLWSIPVTLDVPAELAGKLSTGTQLALRDHEGVMLAALTVTDVWEPDRSAEAAAIFGTRSAEHPGVAHLLRRSNTHYVGGRLEGVELPHHYDFRRRRRTPAELRSHFARLGWRKVVSVHARDVLHRADQEFMLLAAKEAGANVLIHAVVGTSKPGDLDHYARVRCYQALLPSYPKNTVSMSLLPLAARLAGPREALWQAIVARNYGCTHLIVDRDHAGAGCDSSGRPFYGPSDAQESLRSHESELGIVMVPLRGLAYVEDLDKYVPEDEVPEGARVLTISSAELRSRLAEGREIPEWFTFPGVAAELRKSHPPRHRRGFTVFFTGLPSSGKSTIANVLLDKFLEMGTRPVTLLDGDIVRRHLSSELGFSKAHRDINIRRIGFVASEITKNGGIAICAPIAPYASIRKEVRDMIEPVGGLVFVHVATPLEVCESRDRKGLYARARAGIVKEFTGISDPYEVPQDAEVTIDTTDVTPEEAAQQVVLYLEKEGYVAAG